MADKTALETIKGIIEANGGTSDAETIVPALEDLGEVIAAGGGGGMKVIAFGSTCVRNDGGAVLTLTDITAVCDALDAIAADPAKKFEYGFVFNGKLYNGGKLISIYEPLDVTVIGMLDEIFIGLNAPSDGGEMLHVLDRSDGYYYADSDAGGEPIEFTRADITADDTVVLSITGQ